MEILAQGINITDYFDSGVGESGRTIGDYVGYFLQGAMVIAGIIFLFLLISGGVSIIAGAGSGSKDGVAKGKQAVTSALLGFIIIFVSYWIIQLIELITDSNFITNPFS